jgi:hypothetical protein
MFFFAFQIIQNAKQDIFWSIFWADSEYTLDVAN